MFTFLKEFSFLSVLVRLVLAFLCGAVIGYGREIHNKTAGLRTYALTATGAALSVLISLYIWQMLEGPWAEVVKEVGQKFDGSRIASNALTGIGFLAAGSIITGSHFTKKGLTTAAGLFASVCLGLASGAGFFELVVPAVPLLILILNVMDPLEISFKRRMRNMTVYVVFDKLEDLAEVRKAIEERGARIYGTEFDNPKDSDRYGAIFSLKMSKEYSSHSEMLSSIALLPCVSALREIIS